MASNITFSSLITSDDAYRSCTFKQGTSFTVAIAPTDSTGAAVDPTGWTLTGVFKSAFSSNASHYDGRTLITFQLSDNSVILDAANKRFLIPFYEATTKNIRFQGDVLEGVFEFRATAPDGTTIRPLYGPFVLQREVA